MQKKKAGAKPAGAKSKKKEDESKEPGPAYDPFVSTVFNRCRVSDAASPPPAESTTPEPAAEKTPVAATEPPSAALETPNDTIIQDLKSQLADKDALIGTLQAQLSSFQAQEVCKSIAILMSGKV